MTDALQKRASILRPKKRTLVIVVAIILVSSTGATYFLAIYIPSTMLTPCVTTGHTRCFTIVASSNGYNGSVHQTLPAMSVPRGDTVVFRLINNDSVQPHGLAVQFYAPTR